MQRPTTFRLASRLTLSAALFLALLTPAAVLGADPVGGTSTEGQGASQTADATPTASASDQVISVDPTFITATATATPKGAVLSATGRPQRTLPPTDVAVSKHASADARGLALLLLALATICLVAARLPEVRRR